MKQPVAFTILAISLFSAASLTPTADANPEIPEKSVILPTTTTFPLGPVEELPEVRKNLIDLCDRVRIGFSTKTMEKLLPADIAPAEQREAMLKEANQWLDEQNTAFRKKLREAAGLASTDCFAGLKRQAPETATAKAIVTHPEGNLGKCSWELKGLQENITVSFSIKRPVTMKETLRLEVDDGETVIEIPLEWEGKVSIATKLETECSDNVYGAINTPQTHAHAERWCRPELNVSIRCQHPMFPDDGKKDKADEIITLTGKLTEKWSLGTSGNNSTGSYVIPLKAGESLTLHKVPAPKRD